MKTGRRYDTSGLIEAQYEPGSRGRVLKNLLEIKSRHEMNKIEAQEYFLAVKKLSNIYDRNYRFTAADVCKIHKIWLSTIYEWAGQYRQVNITKGNFPFAQEYFLAIQAGVHNDYKPMKKIFDAVIRHTLWRIQR